MTEAKWLTTDKPMYLLRILAERSGQPPDGSLESVPIDYRKLLLCRVAICRLIEGDFHDPRCLRAVEAGEARADGLVDAETFTRAVDGAREALEEALNRWFDEGEVHALRAVAELDRPDLYIITRGTVESVVEKHVRADINRLPPDREKYSDPLHPGRSYEQIRAAAWLTCSDLVREICGNPFRPSTIDPTWLTWNDATIPTLARSIYQEKAFDRLPILADALEEAGCADADLLAHCRVESGHVRGCWALDALLDRR
jgi:hypothetical protein